MITQLGIVIFGAPAILLIGLKDDQWRRVGFLLGLLSQPFWLATTWQGGQWGAFALSCFYTLSWANGLRNNWKE